MSIPKHASRSDVLWSRRQIEGLIADGRSIIIIDHRVLKVDAWMKYHPGGDKSIMHMVGKDATDEVNAYHSVKAREQMENYCIGRIEGRWKNFVPPLQGGIFRPYRGGNKELEEEDEGMCHMSSDSSRTPSPVFDTGEDLNIRWRGTSRHQSTASSISSVTDVDDGMSFLEAKTREYIDLDLAKYPSLDPATQDEIIRKYRLLDQRIRSEGLYNCDYTDYTIELTRYTFLFCMFFLFLRLGWYPISALFLGCLWHQLTFTAHDAGHMGITHNYTADTVIGILVADFIGGLSLTWWKRNHNVHHIVTNSPEHDPDIEHMPFFAISHRFLYSLKSTYYERIMTYDAVAKALLPYQSYLYYFILLFGRFNLYFLSLEHLIFGLGPKKGPAAWHRYLEIVGQIFFWYWFGYGVVYKTIPTSSQRWLFVLISHMVTMPVHAQITLSHFSMSTSELGPHESFPQKMLRTTMDIDCPQWLDFFHGGLQFQAIHHLFPRMPRHNLRRAQKLVQEFCSEVGIPYALYGFVDGSRGVIGRLDDVGKQASILAKCQRSIANRGDILHGQ